MRSRSQSATSRAMGSDDIAIGTNAGGPYVRVFRGGDFAALASFQTSAGSGFRGSTQVALAEMTGDNRADLVVTSLYTGGSRVQGYRGESLAPGVTPVKAFKSLTLGGITSTACSWHWAT